MTQVFILTVSDRADFGRVVHYLAWSSREGAQQKADQVVQALLADEPQFGDTFEIEVQAEKVRAFPEAE